jgi:TfoX/Sxy family transcriptional regulator of competence genes
MPYWEVPAEILEDRQLLKQWAEKAHQIAMK